MNDRMIRTFLVTLAVLVVGCSDGQEPAAVPTGLEPMAAGGPPLMLDEVVNFYWGALHGNEECAYSGTEDANGDWSFPAGGVIGVGGGGACLTAQVSSPNGSGADGFVLWQICPSGAKAVCDSGQVEWVTRTGEDWKPLVNGEYTTESHSTLICGGTLTTVGFRYLYSPRDPNTRNVPAQLIKTSTSIDVTSDGTLTPPGGCPE